MGAEDTLLQLIIDELKRLEASTADIVKQLNTITSQIATLEANGTNVTELKKYIEKLKATLTLDDLHSLKQEAKASREFRIKLYAAAMASGASGYGLVELVKTMIP